MTEWIVIGVLYVAGIGFFQWLGGIASASDAIARWGRSTAEKRRRKGTLPSI
jgi:hypothetical protein